MRLDQFAAEVSLEAPQSALIYGGPKVGKTTLAAAFAAEYNLHWFDLEKGYQTLITCVPTAQMQNIDLFVVQDTQANPRAIKTMTKIVRASGPVKVCQAHGEVACVACGTKKPVPAPMTSFDPTKLTTKDILVVDSLTQLSDSAMAHALGAMGDFDHKKVEFSHYDKQGLLLKNILTAMQRLPCHVIFISHEEELEQEDGSKKLAPVGGTRNFSRKVGRYFDHVIYLEIKNKKHSAISSTTANLKVQSGSRNRVEIEKGESILSLFRAKPDAPLEAAKFNLEDADAKGTPSAQESEEAAQQAAEMDSGASAESAEVEVTSSLQSPVVAGTAGKPDLRAMLKARTDNK